jgi:hypothetical protein
MRTITIKLIGGPLDGESYEERIRDHWEFLRVEYRRNGRLHTYHGEVGRKSAALNYVGSDCSSEVAE